MYLFTVYSILLWGGKDDLIDSEIPEYRRQSTGQGLLVFQDVRLEGRLHSEFSPECSR